mmetsp:Transcript_11645/g.47085  ORF Transcript_11645/g.47085 Transcript_11645/m.47085 type:complete len:85 (-) Transcript_11645:529-783(-)
MYVRNRRGLVVSATCCDRFFVEDGALCRSDFGDDCAAATTRRCRVFAGDCLNCESYCADFFWDSASPLTDAAAADGGAATPPAR